MESGSETQMDLNNNTSHQNDHSIMEMGSGSFGCAHYRRRCKIRAPCCDEIFDCRHCHNESKNTLEVDPLDRHDVPRHDVKRVICSLCNTEQDVQQHCIQCGVCMGNYFCSKCKFFDDDVSKKQYHCDDANGGEQNFFHCNKCECCYSKVLKDSHNCVEKAMHHNCPVCFEVKFGVCYAKYSCPVCSKSYRDMSRVWEKLDQEIAATPMPEMYQNKMVWILCNDCGQTSEVNFHIVAHKCLKCNSYNTRQTQGGPASCSSRITDMVR
ncbi:CHY-type/CTCHY-type/RING-type Zinc finger protein [Prunus dulcis]|uniref:CHY-type/CTCHY-type/RING-type Zinc finger protein n=1 Tax=Prunus dulcis TaxID=3755 RepID=A0A4Y1RVF6_PRUDU|nr:CHY-type/CTCHY-type/RING-type Zinc finger protein [Prunus dulcis]